MSPNHLPWFGMYMYMCTLWMCVHVCTHVPVNRNTILPRCIGDNQVDGKFHQLYHHQLDACISLSLPTSYPRTFF